MKVLKRKGDRALRARQATDMEDEKRKQNDSQPMGSIPS
jgi:hypothetical protein